MGQEKGKGTDMRILHTGDLHLDSPFSGLDIASAERRRREMRDTFSRMMRYAREEALDMVIISGDLFDSSFVTRETVSLLTKEFSALGCPVVITPGNHDPYTEDSVWSKTEFSKNVYIFKSPELERISFDLLSCDVYGYAFTSQYKRECAVSGAVQDGERINILACHADTQSPISSYAPLPLSCLREFSADYAALGHIHTPDAANAAISGLGAYCGCPEGRDFGECGVKGALVVSIEKGNTRIEEVRFCKRIYEEATVSVEGAADMSDICGAVDSFVTSSAYGEEHLLRIYLTGAVSPSLVINTRAAEENKRGLFLLSVVDATSPTLNGEALLSDPGIRGELYRVLLPKLESADPEKRREGALALRYALAALSGEDISDI